MILSPCDSAALQRSLEEHGAVMLRGWEEGPFSKVAHWLGDPMQASSCSAGPRIEVGPGVFTANEAPPCERIPFHHEMAQCPLPPKYVLFYCDTPPAQGGATPIIRSCKVADHLTRFHPDVARRVREQKIRYVRKFPPDTDMTSPLGKSWRSTFGVESRKEAEEQMLDKKMEWEWMQDDWLKTIGPPVPMFAVAGGEEVLFTAAETAFLDVKSGRPEKSFIYGDGTPLDAQTKDAFLELGEFAFRNSTRIPWERGDVLVIDNARVMHARDSFLPPRRILVTLVF